jgi:hypothetical protein
MKDPGFVDEVKRQKFELDPQSGADLEALIKQIYATPKAIVDKVANQIK